MNIFFPERVYLSLQYVDGSDDLLKEIDEFMASDSLAEYSKKSRYLFDVNYNRKALSEIAKMRGMLVDHPNYQREMNIVFLGSKISTINVEDYTSDDDVENVLMFYYFYAEYCFNNCGNKEAADLYINKYLELFNQNKDFEYSDRIYVKVLQYEWEHNKEKFYEAINKKEKTAAVGFSEFNSYIKQSYNEMLSRYHKLQNDSFKEVMKHKFIQEYYNWLKASNDFMINCTSADIILMMQYIEAEIMQLGYKYENFNYNLFMTYYYLFMNYFEVRDFNNAARMLKTNINLINYAYENFGLTLKSLTHHNFHFENEFLRMAMFYSIMLEDYLPDFPVKINIDLIPKDDQPFFKKGIPFDDTLPAYDRFIDTRKAHLKYFDYVKETYEIFNLWIKAKAFLN